MSGVVLGPRLRERILVTDDDPVSCQLFAEVLEGEGYEVDRALRALIDMPGDQHPALAFRRSAQEHARAGDIAVAGLEIGSLQFPSHDTTSPPAVGRSQSGASRTARQPNLQASWSSSASASRRSATTRTGRGSLTSDDRIGSASVVSSARHRRIVTAPL